MSDPKNTPPRPSPLANALAGGSPTTDDPNVGRRAAVKRHIDNVWKHDHRCPLCGNDDWIIDNVANLTVRSTSVFEPERAYPLAPIVCRVCGYTFFVNEKWAQQP